jgi:stage V sporulation protein G
MDISEVRVKLIGNSGDRLRAFCSITLDGEFVIRDLKIIDGPTGAFVAMPSRKLSERCPSCSHKNHLRARFCNFCGTKLPDIPVRTDRNGRDKLHADIAHPINSGCRERIQKRVVEAYEAELSASTQPGYIPNTLDEDFEDEFYSDILEPAERRSHEADADRKHDAVRRHDADRPRADTSWMIVPPPEPERAESRDAGRMADYGERSSDYEEGSSFGEGIL